MRVNISGLMVHDDENFFYDYHPFDKNLQKENLVNVVLGTSGIGKTFCSSNDNSCGMKFLSSLKKISENVNLTPIDRSKSVGNLFNLVLRVQLEKILNVLKKNEKLDKYTTSEAIYAQIEDFNEFRELEAEIDISGESKTYKQKELLKKKMKKIKEIMKEKFGVEEEISFHVVLDESHVIKDCTTKKNFFWKKVVGEKNKIKENGPFPAFCKGIFILLEEKLIRNLSSIGTHVGVYECLRFGSGVGKVVKNPINVNYICIHRSSHNLKKCVDVYFNDFSKWKKEDSNFLNPLLHNYPEIKTLLNISEKNGGFCFFETTRSRGVIRTLIERKKKKKIVKLEDTLPGIFLGVVDECAEKILKNVKIHYGDHKYQICKCVNDSILNFGLSTIHVEEENKHFDFLDLGIGILEVLKIKQKKLEKDELVGNLEMDMVFDMKEIISVSAVNKIFGLVQNEFRITSFSFGLSGSEREWLKVHCLQNRLCLNVSEYARKKKYDVSLFDDFLMVLEVPFVFRIDSFPQILFETSVVEKKIWRMVYGLKQYDDLKPFLKFDENFKKLSFNADNKQINHGMDCFNVTPTILFVMRKGENLKVGGKFYEEKLFYKEKVEYEKFLKESKIIKTTIIMPDHSGQFNFPKEILKKDLKDLNCFGVKTVRVVFFFQGHEVVLSDSFPMSSVIPVDFKGYKKMTVEFFLKEIQKVVEDLKSNSITSNTLSHLCDILCFLESCRCGALSPSNLSFEDGANVKFKHNLCRFSIISSSSIRHKEFMYPKYGIFEHSFLYGLVSQIGLNLRGLCSKIYQKKKALVERLLKYLEDDENFFDFFKNSCADCSSRIVFNYLKIVFENLDDNGDFGEKTGRFFYFKKENKDYKIEIDTRLSFSMLVRMKEISDMGMYISVIGEILEKEEIISIFKKKVIKGIKSLSLSNVPECYSLFPDYNPITNEYLQILNSSKDQEIASKNLEIEKLKVLNSSKNQEIASKNLEIENLTKSKKYDIKLKEQKEVLVGYEIEKKKIGETLINLKLEMLCERIYKNGISFDQLNNLSEDDVNELIPEKFIRRRFLDSVLSKKKV